ncbi:MAG TPA: O-antigen ligase family protein [Actinomycetes bacterium]|nr:O-antigen ligase family protein [Actinomycetes bacterium]
MSLTVLAAMIALLPLLRPAGPGNTAPVDLLIALFLFVAALGLTRRTRPLRIPAGTAILLILLGSVLALIASLDIATGLLTLVVDIYLFALFIAVVNELDNRRSLGLALTVWVVAALGWAVILIGSNQGWLPVGLQELVGVTGDSTERAAAATGNPNMAASYMLSSCFVAMAAPWPARLPARALVLGVLVFAMWVTGSNGALSAFLVGLMVLGLGAYLRGGRTREQVMALVGTAILVGGLLMVVAVSLIGIPSIGRSDIDAFARGEQQGALANSLGRLDRGVDDRLQIWSSGWRSAGPRLAIGVGPGEAINYAVNLSGLHISLHNDMLAYLVERGVLGLLGFVLFHAVLIRGSGRLLVAKGRPIEIYRGLGPAVVANLVFSMSHETLHFRHIWVMYAMVVAAYTVVADRRPAVEPAAAPAPAPEPASVS